MRIAPVGAAVLLCLGLANCGKTTSRVDAKYGVSASERVVGPGQPVPKGGGTYRVGKPYVVAGRVYVPQENTKYRAEGVASWYGDDFHGRRTANGEIFDMTSITAAHPTLPIPSYVRVTNLKNRRSLIVRVNDRGPYAHDRIIDLSVRAAKLLDFHGRGLAKVRVEYVGKAPLSGSDDTKLAATLRENGHPLDSRPTAIAAAKPETMPEPRPQRGRTVVASADPTFAPDLLDATPIAQTPAPPQREAVRAGNRYVLASAGERPAHDIAGVATMPVRIPQPAVRSARLDAPPAPPAPSAQSLAPRSLGTLPAPVSAYAAPRYDGAAGLMSGRGLY